MESLPLTQADYANLARIAARLAFFSPFKGSQLDSLLNRIELHEFKAGETIFRKDDPSDALYIINEGKIVIRLGTQWLWLLRKVAHLGAGDIFGEMGLLDNIARSGTAVAETQARLFVFLRKDFDLLMRENPIFAEGMRLVSEKRKFVRAHT